MRMTKYAYVTAALLAATLTVPAASWAQSAAATSNAADDQQEAPAKSPREAVEQRIADLHATLKITPAQEAKFDAFAQVMLDNAQAMQGVVMKAHADAATATADQSLKSYAMIAKEHAEKVHKLSMAFDKLYVALTPDQKMAADDAFRSAAADRQMKKAGG